MIQDWMLGVGVMLIAIAVTVASVLSLRARGSRLGRGKGPPASELGPALGADFEPLVAPRGVSGWSVQTRASPELRAALHLSSGPKP